MESLDMPFRTAWRYRESRPGNESDKNSFEDVELKRH
jgi:hypothetical protein